MVEIRGITAVEDPSHDHVLIVCDPGGKYIATGSMSGRMEASFWAPAPFNDFQVAIEQALAWAKANNVTYVYVRDEGACSEG
jgi:hypothetical protein